MRRVAMQVITYGMIMSWGIVGWKLVVCLAGCDPPFAVVFHASMGPAFRKGDILWLQKNKAPIDIGEIVVFKVNEESAPIVHRVITVHQRRHKIEEADLLTKGDNNDEDDRSGTYTEGRMWLTLDHVYGRVRWYFPYIGWGIIMVAMKPFVKYPVMIGAVGMYLVATK